MARLNLTAVLLCLTLIACSRQPRIPVGAENPATDQSLPFDGASQKTGISPTRKLVPGSLPSGTVIHVRLRTPISSASSASGDFFDAVLDEPLVIDGKAVVSRGAFVKGRVVGAKASGNLQDPGYLRLTLTRILVNGKFYPVQSSSIFVKGGSHQERTLAMIGAGTNARAMIGNAGEPKGALVGTAAPPAILNGEQDIGFAPGHRLTFRLNEPLSVTP
jgi:hypothetical protein